MLKHIQSLLSCSWPPTRRTVGIVSGVGVSLAALYFSSPLRRFFSGSTSEIRYSAEDLAGRKPDAREHDELNRIDAATYFLNFTNSQNFTEVRWAALEKLSYMGPYAQPYAIELAELLKDKKHFAFDRILKALSTMGRSAEKAISLLDSMAQQNPDVADRLHQTIANIGIDNRKKSDSTTNSLLAEVALAPTDTAKRREAFSQFAREGELGARNLIPFLGDDRWEKEVSSLIVEMDEDAAAALLDASQHTQSLAPIARVRAALLYVHISQNPERKGADIGAACGQLATESKKTNLKSRPVTGQLRNAACH